MLKLLFLSLMVAGCLFAQQQLTNKSIGDLIKAGVSPAEVIRVISQAHNFSFDLRQISLYALRDAGVPEDVMKAMAAKQMGLSVEPTGAGKSEKNESRIRLTPSDSKPRVFVEDSNDSWSYTASKYFGQGGTHPQTVELIKTFAKNCPAVVVTDDEKKADFKVRFERESNKGIARRDNKFAAFNSEGDLVFADSTRSLGNSVKAFCAAIQK